MFLELVPISQTGAPERPWSVIPPVAAEAISSTVKLYRRVGYEPPWIGYLAVENEICVGICGFTRPPRDHRVEIAYFTVPGNEGRGIATRMAGALVDIARTTDAGLIIAAQTLPQDSASTSILKKLGFVFFGAVEHPEDGHVWEWRHKE